MILKHTAAIGRVMDAVQASNPLEATRLIQQALRETGRQQTHYTNSQPTAADLPMSYGNDREIPRSKRTNPRTGLTDTIDALRAFKTPRHVGPHRPDNTLPESRNFQKRNFACASGQRDFRLYVPSTSTPRGLIVMLHGCQQTAEDFAVGTNMNAVGEEHDLLVAYPHQPRSANPSSCWNWFRPQDQSRVGGEAEIIAGLTQSLLDEFGFPGQNVFVAGLSSGGAMAAVLGSTYPALYSSVGVHSGLAYKSAHDVNSAFAAMRGQHRAHSSMTTGNGFQPRLIVFHGSSDQTVAPANATALWEDAIRSRGAGDVLELTVSAGGRAIDRRIFAASSDVRSVEEWIIRGSGHCWSGGNPNGSYTDADGPNASAEMVRFFLCNHTALVCGDQPA